MKIWITGAEIPPLSGRTRADVTMAAEVEAIRGQSRGTYGAPRVHAELRAAGVPGSPFRN